MKINFKARKTELQWQEDFDNFWVGAMPLWFDWLQWIIVLGVVSFLAQQSRNIVLLITYTFSYIALFFYLQGIFFTIEFKGFPLMKSKRLQKVISIVISGILSFSIWYFLTNLILRLQGKTQ
jgi:hypothetical protein